MFSFCRNKSAEKGSYTPPDVEPGDINSYIEKWTATNTNIILEKSKNHSETGV